MPATARTAGVLLDLPDWLVDTLEHCPERIGTIEARMRFVIELARRNVGEDGGPFAAAVFEQESGRLIAVGVNRVVGCRTSIAHAEVMAIATAQQALRCFDLSAAPASRYQLVSSCEPCLMCLGAVHWSGLSSLVCGARGEDAVAAGFDEGPKPAAWNIELARRGISVQSDVCRAESVSLLSDYVEAGGLIYNPARR